MHNIQADITIVGAGPIGLFLAKALSGQGLKVLVVEERPLSDLKNPTFDGREIALTHRSFSTLRRLGAEAYLDSQTISPVRVARVFDGPFSRALEIRPSLERSDKLGWLVSNFQIRRAAYSVVCNAKACHSDIELQASNPIRSVEPHEDHVALTLASGTRVTTKLLVAADGRHSATRRMMNIPVSIYDSGQSVLVWRVTHDKQHEDAVWQWFKYGESVTLLPLRIGADAGGRASSIAVTSSTSVVKQMSRMGVDEFGRYAETLFERRLGAMKLISSRHVYPVQSGYARTFIAERFAVVGDAAVGMLPLTAHGFNLGLESCVALANVLTAAHRKGVDIGATSILRSFDMAHRRATRPVYMAGSLLSDVYSGTSRPSRFLRQTLLRCASRFFPVTFAIGELLSA